MGSKIEWTDETWNPITGCTKISEGCKNCYAEKMAKRLAGRFGYPADDPFKVTFHPDKLNQPLKWKKPRRIFVTSMGDLFNPDVTFDFINKIYAIQNQASQHKYLWLTKRPEIMWEWVEQWKMKTGQPKLWSHTWLGVSVENQRAADERIPILLQIPAAVRFVSVEPMLGGVDLTSVGSNSHSFQRTNVLRGTIAMFVQPVWTTQKIDWVICGCESGQNRRFTNWNWIENLKNQCVQANVPFFLKQIWNGYRIVKMPLLDGKVWNEYPDK